MFKTFAIILKKQNIGETDRILTIMSPTLGKKRVVARGIRRPLSKLAGHLDTLMLSQIMLTDEPDLPKVTGANLTESFDNIRSSLDLTNKAFSIIRIIERVLLEDAPQRQIFQLTVESLGRLDESDLWPAVWLRFLSELTDKLGLGISKFDCIGCGKPIREKALFLVDERALYCSECSLHQSGQSLELSNESVKLLIVMKKQPYAVIRRLKIPFAAAQSIEQLLLLEITQWFNKPWRDYASLA